MSTGTTTATAPTYRYMYHEKRNSVALTDYHGRGPRNNGHKQFCVTVNVNVGGAAYECVAVLRTNDQAKARRFANQAWALRHRNLQVWNGTAKAALAPLLKAAS
jgi:hypothetical protein